MQCQCQTKGHPWGCCFFVCGKRWWLRKSLSAGKRSVMPTLKKGKKNNGSAIDLLISHELLENSKYTSKSISRPVKAGR